MTRLRISRLLIALLLAIAAPGTSAWAESAPAQDVDDASPRIQRQDGHSALSFGVVPAKENDFNRLLATFDFGQTKGLGGSDDMPVVNADKSLIAVTNYPATKTSYVHLFVRHRNGDLTVINSFNQRVAKLLTGRWAKAAEYRLSVESISGRVIQLSVFDYVQGNQADEFKLKVSIGQDGTLTRVRIGRWTNDLTLVDAPPF